MTDSLRRDSLEDRAARGEWQPIETAPKDGSRFLAYAMQKADEYDEHDRLVRKGVEERFCVVAYWLFGNAVSFPFTGGLPLNVWYTHWMPLPEPPSGSPTSES